MECKAAYQETMATTAGMDLIETLWNVKNSLDTAFDVMGEI